ncbi:MAG: hypothetical protein U0271_00265 [Polyangiaceae bacterium]
MSGVLVVWSAGCGGGGGEGKTAIDVSPDAPSWLDDKVVEVGHAAAPEAVQVGTIYKGVAEKTGERTDWKVQLEANQCYWFSGVGDDTVERLHLFLFDGGNKRVAIEKSKKSTSTMTYCAEKTDMYRLQAKVQAGAGHFGVGIFSRKAPPKDVAEKPKPRDLSEDVEREASAVAPGSTRVGNYFQGSVDKTEWYTQLEVGKCYWFVAVGDADVDELSLYLWGPDNKRITENKSDSTKSNIGHCPKQSGMYKFQAKVTSGSGSYTVGVYAKAR